MRRKITQAAALRLRREVRDLRLLIDRMRYGHGQRHFVGTVSWDSSVPIAAKARFAKGLGMLVVVEPSSDLKFDLYAHAIPDTSTDQ